MIRWKLHCSCIFVTKCTHIRSRLTILERLQICVSLLEPYASSFTLNHLVSPQPFINLVDGPKYKVKTTFAPMLCYIYLMMELGGWQNLIRAIEVGLDIHIDVPISQVLVHGL